LTGAVELAAGGLPDAGLDQRRLTSGQINLTTLTSAVELAAGLVSSAAAAGLQPALGLLHFTQQLYSLINFRRFQAVAGEG
jgi:hypothetical protein